jgi:V8-like Glu-specific endopeptidase
MLARFVRQVRKSLSGPGRCGAARSSESLSRPRPRLEALEDRVVPANSVVGSTTSFPFNAAGRVTATWDLNRNGRIDSGDHQKSGSGALISRSHALTAAHMIYDMDPTTSARGWATWVSFAPGANGSSHPYGDVRSRRLTVPTSWTQGNANSDIGIITLSQSFNSTGVFQYGYLSDSYLKPGLTVNMIHYPGKESGFDGQRRQWLSSGPIASRNSQTFSYNKANIRSVKGSSGAPVYVYNLRVNGQLWNRVIVGVNVRGTDGMPGIGESIRLNKTWFDFIGNVLRSNSNTSAPALARTAVSATSAQGGAVGQPLAALAQPTGLLVPPQWSLQPQAGPVTPDKLPQIRQEGSRGPALAQEAALAASLAATERASQSALAAWMNDPFTAKWLM